MKLIFSEEQDNKTSSGYVLDDSESNKMEGGSPLEGLAVPAGLFFLQQAFHYKTPSSLGNTTSKSDDGIINESLYERLQSLVDDSSSQNENKGKVKRKTKRKDEGRKERKTKTKKNN